jgi:putative membrane protein
VDHDLSELDYRFSLANERTFLAWTRTSIALIAGGAVAAKALNFHHDAWRWVIAVPPIVGGALLALDATARWRTYEREMRTGARLSAGRGLKLIGVLIFIYAVVVLVAAATDG